VATLPGVAGRIEIRLAENESHTFQRGNAVLISSTTALKIRKRGGKWYVFVNYHGKRKAKCVGTSRELAEQVRRQLEARLTLGDLALFDSDEKIQTFGSYADKWLKEYARVECKTSTADGYEGVIEQYLRPRFGNRILDQTKRDDVKAMINELIAKALSRNTVRNALCVIRGIFNEAIEAGIVEVNPAARLGRFTRTAKKAEVKGRSLTSAEAEQFLQAAKEICPEYHPLFLIALRAAFAEASWSPCSGETSSSGETSRIRIASSSSSTTMCGVNTPRLRARKAVAWTCRGS
jgi:hypothetical protein